MADLRTCEPAVLRPRSELVRVSAFYFLQTFPGIICNSDISVSRAPAGVCADRTAVRRARVSRAASRGCRRGSSSSHTASASRAGACKTAKAFRYVISCV